MSRYREFVDFHCMPLPLGFLCWLEDNFPGRDSRAIHRYCELQEVCESRNGRCTLRCHLYCVVRLPDNDGHPKDPCPEEDWICKLHDAALDVSAFLRLPICRGTWRK